MVKIVLVADGSLTSTYRDLPLAGFLSCMPVEHVPEPIFNFIAPMGKHDNGVARFVPYGLRKLEAALVRDFSREDVVVAHPKYVSRFISNDTKIVGVHTMDPFGMGPVSMMFTYGGQLTAYSWKRFWELMKAIGKSRLKRDFVVAIGGPGTWQFEYKPWITEKLGIDYVVTGELDHIAGETFNKMIHREAPAAIKIPPSHFPKVNEIPNIVNPSIHGMIECMRGCGRGCSFCEPNMRAVRYMEPEKVVEEAKVNIKAGLDHVWVQSEDIWMYKLEDKSSLNPNTDAIIDLFSAVMSTKGIAHANPTHGSLPAAASDPGFIRRLSGVLKAGPDNWIGIQPGLETGSVRLAKRYLGRKSKPFETHEWHDVVVSAVKTFNENYWFPAMTLITGLPGEQPEDLWETIGLIDKLESIPNHHMILAPLSFVPVGALRNKEFFDMDEMINEASFCMIYRCWRNNLLEMKRNLWSLNNNNIGIKMALDVMSKVMGNFILRGLEKYGRSRGFDYTKAFRAGDQLIEAPTIVGTPPERRAIAVPISNQSTTTG